MSGNYSTRKMREYVAKRRGSVSYKSMAEDAAVLAAVAAGEVCEMRAAKVLDIDLVTMRERLNALVKLGCKRAKVKYVGVER